MYSDEELIEDVKRLSQEYCNGSPPPITYVDEKGKFCSSTYSNRFDGWEEVLERCGFSKHETNKTKGSGYKKEFIVEEIQRVSEEFCNGKAPKMLEFREYSKISSDPVYNFFDSWSEAIVDAGLQEKDVGMDTYSKEYIIEEILKVSKSFCDGETPTQKEINKYSDISAPTIARHFGSYNNAIESIGLKVNNRRNITDEELIAELKRISKQFLEGRRPKRKELNKYSEHSHSIYVRRFGSWSDAVEEAGFNRKYERGYEYSSQEIINEIKRISNIINKEKPTTSDFDKHSYLSRGVFINRPETWNDFLEKSGFSRNNFGYNAVSGEDHAHWKGGGEIKYGPSYYKRKWEVRERDRENCQVCGFNNLNTNLQGIIDVHHITPERYWNVEKEHEKMNNPRNLICLCRSCHHKLEGKFKGRNYEEFKRLGREELGIDEEPDQGSVFDY